LERMHGKMKEACVALEQADPVLFQKAMVKTVGDYFPVERRLPVDTPPARGWPSDDEASAKS
jgi:hypothetical protein